MSGRRVREKQRPERSDARQAAWNPLQKERGTKSKYDGPEGVAKGVLEANKHEKKTGGHRKNGWIKRERCKKTDLRRCGGESRTVDFKKKKAKSSWMVLSTSR